MTLAALVAAFACTATPVHAEPLPHTGSLSGLRWVQAAPHRAGIVGMLFADTGTPVFSLWTRGRGPNGLATKVLWIVRNVHAGPALHLRGNEVGGTTTFRQTFPVTGVRQYPSIVVLPHAGCWRLDLTSGTAKGTLLVLGVDA